ncbi:MAG TPA: DUF2079 domain-containing protein [Polyangiaceae bacterium]|nr:DUF2079 domain-containing protein [Polyangiaceae bacterium]
MAGEATAAGQAPHGPAPEPAAATALHAAVVGALLVAGATGSVTAGIALCFVDAGRFVAENVATPAERNLVFGALTEGFGSAFVLALVFAAVLGARGARAVHRAGRIVSPLIVSCTVPMLLDHREWNGRPLPFLLLLSVSALLLEATTRAAISEAGASIGEFVAGISERLPAWIARHAPSLVVLSGASAYAAFTAYFSIQQHQRLATLAFDLGIYDNLLYNALHGHFFRSPVLLGPDGGNYIAGHAEFIMLAYVPLYALWPRAEMLLVMQSCLFGFAAFPLFKFARTQMPPWAAVAVALAYLCYAPLHGPNFYDFHWLPTAIPFHFLLYYSLATRRKWLSVFCVVWLLLVREDVSVGLAILGTFLALSGIRVRFGIVLAVVSVAYFGVVKFIVMPWAGPWSFLNMYKDLIPQGESGYGAVIRTVITNPAYFVGTLLVRAKAVYALQLFTPVVFLPWRRLGLALLASAGFFFTLMTTGYEPTLSIAFQYTTHWIPYIFGASVLSLRLLGAEPFRRQAAIVAMAFATAGQTYVFGCFFQHDSFVGGFGRVPFRMTESERVRYQNMVAITAKIPRDASVAATESEVPHVSNRVTVFALRDHSGGADYLLVNRDMRNHLRTHQVLVEAFRDYPYGLVERRDSLFLFRRNENSAKTPAALRELGIQ